MAPVALAINTPSALRAEHEELHAELEAAARLPGGLGQAAQAIADALHPPFAKDEMYAMPALGALPALAAGKIPRNVEEVRALAERLDSELEQMIREHRVIVAALKQFAELAHHEGRTDLVQLAIKLKLHAANEEEVLYRSVAAMLAEQDVEC